MPTVNEVLGGLLQKVVDHGFKSWKSTAQSILTTTFGITGYLMVSHTISAHTAALAVTVNGICKVLIGVIQAD